MIQIMSIMIALAAAVTFGAPGGNKLFDNTAGGPFSAQTDYNNNSAPRAETQSGGINPVQHSE